MYRSSHQARTEVRTKYPAIDTLDWPTEKAKALYDPRSRGDGRHCPQCHRAFDGRRYRGVHRGVIESDAVVSEVVHPATKAKVHGGPGTIWCSESCRRQAMDARTLRAGEWRECEVCCTWFYVWVPASTPGKTRRPIPTTCPPPWTPGERVIYTRLRSDCYVVAKEQREHVLRVSTDKEVVEAREQRTKALAIRQGTYNQKRRAARAETHEAIDAAVFAMIELVNALRAAADETEKEMIGSRGRPTVDEDPDMWIASVIAHLRRCRACHEVVWAHRHRRAILAASEGRLGEWKAEQAARQAEATA